MWLEIYRCLGPWVLRDPWTLNLEILWYGLLWEGGGYEIIQVKCRWRDFNLIQLRKVSWVVLVGGIAIIASSFRSRFFRDLKQTSDLARAWQLAYALLGAPDWLWYNSSIILIIHALNSRNQEGVPKIFEKGTKSGKPVFYHFGSIMFGHLYCK